MQSRRIDSKQHSCAALLDGAHDGLRVWVFSETLFFGVVRSRGDVGWNEVLQGRRWIYDERPRKRKISFSYEEDLVGGVERDGRRRANDGLSLGVFALYRLSFLLGNLGSLFYGSQP